MKVLILTVLLSFSLMGCYTVVYPPPDYVYEQLELNDSLFSGIDSTKGININIYNNIENSNYPYDAYYQDPRYYRDYWWGSYDYWDPYYYNSRYYNYHPQWHPRRSHRGWHSERGSSSPPPKSRRDENPRRQPEMNNSPIPVNSDNQEPSGILIKQNEDKVIQSDKKEQPVEKKKRAVRSVKPKEEKNDSSDESKSSDDGKKSRRENTRRKR